jgi:hypothetical protein
MPRLSDKSVSDRRGTVLVSTMLQWVDMYDTIEAAPISKMGAHQSKRHGGCFDFFEICAVV